MENGIGKNPMSARRIRESAAVGDDVPCYLLL